MLAASLAAAICTGIVAVVIAGVWALVYMVLYVAATLPGWPLGRTLFGRSHPVAWIAGALLGYALTCLALWGVIALGIPSRLSFTLSWAAVCGVTFLLARSRIVRSREPFVHLPAWTTRDARILICLLLLVPAVFVFPYRNLGAGDELGTRYYRAYFTADFIWHTALTAELTKYDMPPINPYLGDRSIQYYWTYFLVPAVIAQEGPRGLHDVETVLKVNSLCSGVLFIAALVAATWAASLSAAGTAIAVAIAVVSASAEGLYAIWDLAARGRSLAGLRDMNIDAITSWEFSGLRVDSLVRSMWYNPQHSMAAALGLLALPVAGTAGAAASGGAIMLAGLALALSTTFNPLIGGLLSLIYGAVVFLDAARGRHFTLLLNHVAAAVLVAAAVAWCIGNQMVEGAAGVVLFGLGGYARNAPVATMLLSIGPLLLPAVLGVWPPRNLPRTVWPSFIGALVGVLVFYFVRLSVERSYIGFRAGQIVQLTLPGLAALFFGRWWGSPSRRGAAATAAALLILVGLPTTLIDTFNAQDIANRHMGPGFRWTIAVTPDEQEAFRWLRQQTPKDAVVQMDPVAHGRETWSQLPTFAWRRTAAAKPISLMNIPAYDQRSRLAHQMYAQPEADAAAQIARQLGIDYVFVGPAERAVNPVESLAKFDARPDLFVLVFANTHTRLYEVQPSR